MTDWSQVVRRHGPLVWKTAWRLLGNEADVADCFQNAFLAALEVSRRQRVGSWAALLRYLATVKALERLRQRYRRADRLVPLADFPVADTRSPAPHRAAEADELAMNLRNALADYRQIAEQLGLTVSHVGVLLNRARTQLRRRLRAHAPQGAGRDGGKEIQS
jgi:RNA polymerase sigma-70 factor (ECF subfamily)